MTINPIIFSFVFSIFHKRNNFRAKPSNNPQKRRIYPLRELCNFSYCFFDFIPHSYTKAPTEEFICNNLLHAHFCSLYNQIMKILICTKFTAKNSRCFVKFIIFFLKSNSILTHFAQKPCKQSVHAPIACRVFSMCNNLLHILFSFETEMHRILAKLRSPSSAFPARPFLHSVWLAHRISSSDAVNSAA